MKRFWFFSLIVLSYNTFLLILPLIIFLGSLSLSQEALIDAFSWLYWPFVCISPALTAVLCYQTARINHPPHNWLLPVMISFIGFLPLWILYLLLQSLWNLYEYLLVISFPILLGLISSLAAFIYQELLSPTNKTSLS